MINISPRQLEVFVAIASAGTVRAAAEQLHLTQPAASMALSELEGHLGEQLFARENRRLRLNEHGRELLPRAQEVLDRLREVQQLGSSRSRELSGQLRIGASNTVGNYRVGDLLADFVREQPQVAVRLQVGNTSTIVEAIRQHELDIGCVEGTVTQTGVEVRPWRQDALIVCAPADHPLARRDTLQAEDFAGARWIMREPGSATRTQTERVLASLPPGQTVLELGQIEAIKQAVIAGLGVACLPRVAVGNAAQEGRLQVLDTPFLHLERRLSLVLSHDKYRGALVNAFLRSVVLQR